MRNGLQKENETTTETLRRKFAAEADAIVKRAKTEQTPARESEETLQTATIATNSPVQSEEKELWQEVRRELVHQNLFGPRDYCKRMTYASLITMVVHLGLYTILVYGRLIQGPGFLIAGLPILFWAIAFVLYFKGGYASDLPDQKLMVRQDGKSEVLNEAVIRATAIVSRDKNREKARQGDFLFWIGVGLALFFLFGMPR
jgi:hypothetical protein